MSLGLCIDTSFLGSRLAVLDIEDDFKVSWSHLSLDRQTTLVNPLESLDEFLNTSSLQYSDIKGVLVGVGPGSFTGIKIGLSFAYGLLQGSKDRGFQTCRGFSFLEEFMKSHSKASERSFSSMMLPSTKKSAYISWFDGQEAKTCSYYFDSNVPQLAEALKQPLVVGEPQDKSVYSDDADFLKLETVNQKSLSLFRTVFKLEWPDAFDSTAPEPKYLRKSTPEERLIQ